MKIYSLIELLHLSRIELCDQLARLTNALPDQPPGSDDEYIVRQNMRLVRRALALRHPPPS